MRFVPALLVGHLVAAALPGRPRRPWTLLWGAVVWIVTVLGGILLRLATGDTAEVPFIIVATIVLGVFLLGWRALAALLRRRGRDRDENSGRDDADDAVRNSDPLDDSQPVDEDPESPRA